jgi:hypothetical protein
MFHDHLLLIVIVSVTSGFAVALAWPRGNGTLGKAALATVEVVGATMLFFLANVAVGMALVLAARRFTQYYPTLYEVSDVALLLFSLVQALVLQIFITQRTNGK